MCKPLIHKNIVHTKTHSFYYYYYYLWQKLKGLKSKKEKDGLEYDKTPWGEAKERDPLEHRRKREEPYLSFKFHRQAVTQAIANIQMNHQMHSCFSAVFWTSCTFLCF